MIERTVLGLGFFLTAVYGVLAAIFPSIRVYWRGGRVRSGKVTSIGVAICGGSLTALAIVGPRQGTGPQLILPLALTVLFVFGWIVAVIIGRTSDIRTYRQSQEPPHT